MALAAQLDQKLMLDMQAPAVTDLTGADVCLFTNNPALTPAMTPATFVEPTGVNFPGYGRQPLSAPAPSTNTNSDLLEVFPSVTFSTSAAPPLPLTINGYFVFKTITAIDYALMAEFFDSPVVVSFFPQQINIVLEIIMPNIRNFGGLCTICA